MSADDFKVVMVPVELAITYEQHAALLSDREADQAINKLTGGILDAWLADQLANQ